MKVKKKLIVISAPSGGGKSVVTRHIIKLYPDINFSISATTRPKRPLEIDGKDYFFIEKKEFHNLIEKNQLVEYEEIFGNFYGTLKSEIDKSLSQENMMIFDIDVKGALALQKSYPNDTLLVFLAPPSIEVLKKRLSSRRTETSEQIENRLSRASMEIEMSKNFDYIIVNDVLETTFKKIESILKNNFYM